MANLTTVVIPKVINHTLHFSEEERLQLLASLRYTGVSGTAQCKSLTPLALELIKDLLRGRNNG